MLYSHIVAPANIYVPLMRQLTGFLEQESQSLLELGPFGSSALDRTMHPNLRTSAIVVSCSRLPHNSLHSAMVKTKVMFRWIP